MPIVKLKQILFGPESTLSRLSASVASHEALLIRVHRALPESLTRHCIAVSVDGDMLVIVTDSASWATQLRFHEQIVLSDLATDKPFKGIRRLSVRVRMGRDTPATEIDLHPDNKISTQGRNIINSCANSITDKPLSNALRRLARYASGKSDQPE